MRFADHAGGSTVAEGDWADQTRRVVTRDLLLRAHRAQTAESRALRFRALHLKLPLVREIADGLVLEEADRTAVEHDAMDGLVQALRAFDACGDQDFADFASPFVEREIRRTLQIRGRI